MNVEVHIVTCRIRQYPFIYENNNNKKKKPLPSRTQRQRVQLFGVKFVRKDWCVFLFLEINSHCRLRNITKYTSEYTEYRIPVQKLFFSEFMLRIQHMIHNIRTMSYNIQLALETSSRFGIHSHGIQTNTTIYSIIIMLFYHVIFLFLFCI